ncbi:hypothetical protein R5R35_003794 [Gryllus longicercus]|uniref:G-protein coupled receptors family 1 profile domain-containing protein n=1 Tax=Gryllus longicercus TaxID=2509291 RepID=A0AAN9VEP0_9ORTH
MGEGELPATAAAAATSTTADTDAEAAAAAATAATPLLDDGATVPAPDLNDSRPDREAQNVTFNSFYFYQTEQFTVLWILFALIVLGNLAVLAALAMNKRRKSRMNFFIMQLALADLSVGLISVLTDIVWRHTIAWNAGNAACKVIRFLQAVVTYSSTYVLVALSIDRYDAITHPMNFSGSWRRARLLVGVAWVISALFSVPILFLYQEQPVEGHLQCWIDFEKQWMWQLWVTLVALTLFVLPAFIISACYIVIVSTIWTKSKQLTPDPTRRTSRNSSVQQLQQTHQQLQLQNSGKPRGVASRLQQLQQEDQDSRRASSRGIIPKAKVKTVKMTFVIVIVFVLCWSPYFVFDLLQVYGYVPRTQTNIAVATFIQSLAPLNSAANPVIYCLFSTTIGRTLRKIPPISWAVAALQPCCPSLRPVPPDEEEPALLDARMRWASQHHKAHPHLDAAVRRGTAVAAVVSIV